MKLGKLLSLVIALFLATNVMGGIVQPNDAATVARNFMYERSVKQGLSLSINEVQPQLFQVRESNGQPSFYVFNMENDGWVIVSGDDLYTPIIGYATTGKFPTSQLDKNFSSFIQGYVDQIEYGRSIRASATPEIAERWSQYTTMGAPRIAIEGERDVDPLFTNTWNQDFPYNAYCPEDAAGSGGHVYAGCVATAMSMIMHYYRYPEVGTGSHSYYCAGYGTQTANFGNTHYNWDAMQNSINSNMGESVNAIAELQYHCGVAVNMMYSFDGSGAYSENVPDAIISYFGYSSTAAYILKVNYTATVWENTIMAQLDAAKPFYYSGQSSEGGHAFGLDGYQVTGSGKLFHFNFGWSGSGNGFFTLTDVNGYSSRQGMVKNFFPGSVNYPDYCDDHTITSSQGSFEDGSSPLNTYLANSGCSWLIAPTDSVNSITLTFTEIDFAAGDSIKVYAGATENDPLLATYGSGSSIAALTSPTNRMLVKFITDGSEEGAGFKADFNSIYPVFCASSTNNLTGPAGDLSDGSGAYNYNNNTVCKWKIVPGQWSKNLTLAFSSFDLEQDKDFLKVFAVPSNTVLATLTGNTIPDPIVAPDGQNLMIMFSTNGFNNNQGFEASYYISNVNTSNEDITRNLAIYPNPAGSYTEVKFNVVEPANVKISILNLLGEEVYAEPVQLLSGYVSRTLQLGSLSKGLYLLRVSSDKGSVVKKLIIK